MQPAQLYFFLYLSKLNSPETSANERVSHFLLRVSHFLPRVGYFTLRVCQFLIRVIFFIPRVCHFHPRGNDFLPRVDDFALRGRRFPPRGWRFTRADGFGRPQRQRREVRGFIGLEVDGRASCPPR